MFVIRNIKTPDRWSEDDWSEYVFGRLEQFMAEENIEGDLTEYKVVEYSGR